MNIKTAAIIGSSVLIIAILLGAGNDSSAEYFGESEYSEGFSYAPGQNQNEEIYIEENEANYNQNVRQTQNQGHNQNSNQTHNNYGNEKIIMHPMMDKKRNIPFGHYPLPASWKIQDDGWYGPHNTVVKFNTSNQIDINQQRYQSPKDILAGELGTIIKNNKGTILRQEALDQIARTDLNYNKAIATQPMQYQNEALGIYIEADGEKGYGIIKTSLMRHDFGGGWNYAFITIEADPTYLESAITHTKNAMSHFKPNMKQIAMYKSHENQKANASWAAHNSRMSNNQRHFEARNKAWNDANNATNDAIMGAWKSSSESFDRTNQMTTNGIWNENTVASPFDGSSHQTDNNYDRTFMNAFGDQIQTNDQFYEPGLDHNANGYEEVYPYGG